MRRIDLTAAIFAWSDGGMGVDPPVLLSRPVTPRRFASGTGAGRGRASGAGNSDMVEDGGTRK